MECAVIHRVYVCGCRQLCDSGVALPAIEDDVKVADDEASYTRPEEVEEFVERTGVDSLDRYIR